ncbi:hypothetical protein WG899_18095 [Paucibacter sp. AS339]|uniref:hypothetical protein n=1 Tax=Paucibacter hankyongi TaxID=3133434 RepID=UPI0030A3F3FB
MPSIQQELGLSKAKSAGPQQVAPGLARGLQEELTKALSLALSQLEQLGRPGSRRSRLAHRRAQEFVESALETSQLLLADLQQSPEPLVHDRVAPARSEPQHELLVTLRRQLATHHCLELRTLPILHQGPLPELPRIVARTIAEVTMGLLEGEAGVVSGLRIGALPHGLSLQLLCRPMAERDVAEVRQQLDGKLAGGTATRLALVGAGIGAGQAQHSDVLSSILWPALADEPH